MKKTTKSKIKKVTRLLLKWLGIFVAMVLFTLAAMVFGEWFQEKVWVIFALDGIFCFLLYLLLNLFLSLMQSGVGRYDRLTERDAIKIVVYVFIMAIVLFIILATTLGLFDVLLVRFNIIILPIMALMVVYNVARRHKRFWLLLLIGIR